MLPGQVADTGASANTSTKGTQRQRGSEKMLPEDKKHL